MNEPQTLPVCETPYGENLEALVCAEISVPFDIHAPAYQSLPLVVSSPHSGREYPASFLAASKLDFPALRRSEDSFVDCLFADAPEIGGYLLAARFPRAYVDVNREPYELDPDMFDAPLPDYVDSHSRRAANGLGTIARIVADDLEIYRERLSFQEAERRIQSLYMPFREALDGLVEATHRRFDCAVLLDCHSMPSSAIASDSYGKRADIVLGDCHGASADADLMEAARETLEQLGYRVACNHPYAGGAITRSYGRPREGLHALQLEIDRALYMDERSFRLLDEYHRLRQDMHIFMSRLGSFSLQKVSILSAKRECERCALPTLG